MLCYVYLEKIRYLCNVTISFDISPNIFFHCNLMKTMATIIFKIYFLSKYFYKYLIYILHNPFTMLMYPDLKSSIYHQVFTILVISVITI